MTTLSSVIEQIDLNLENARERSDATQLSPFLTGEQEQLKRYIHIAADTTRLLVPVDDLSEVGTMPEITSLPNLPDWILGIVSLREEIVSVVDVNRLFFPGLTSGKIGDRFFILQSGKMKVGFRITQILATISRPDSDRITRGDTELAGAAPDVFNEGMEVDGSFCHILEADKLFAYSRLMNYYEE